MSLVCLYFQVHQPYRLRSDFNYFLIGTGQEVEDQGQNTAILRRISERSYLKANQILLELIKKHGPKFRVAFSISGVALEQMAEWTPEVLASFRALADTKCVEFLGETYYHSLAAVFSEREWRRQVKLHKAYVKKHLGVDAKVFRNTELIYNNDVARWAEDLGFSAILAEGTPSILGWRNPHFVYQPQGTREIKLLLRNYGLSDDIAFRFSDPSWSAGPLTAPKYAQWLEEASQSGETINIFLDYETFGEHHGAGGGIFDFLRALPEAVLAKPHLRFATPSQVAKEVAAQGTLDVPHFTSWADSERDLSAWMGNHLQKSALGAIYELEKDVIGTKNEPLIHLWGKLQTSDHFYYMSTKKESDGEVHRYFSPFASPYDAFITFSNALSELRYRVQLAVPSKKPRTAQNAEISPLRSPLKGARSVPASVRITSERTRDEGQGPEVPPAPERRRSRRSRAV